jgi:hypothetical protein
VPVIRLLHLDATPAGFASGKSLVRWVLGSAGACASSMVSLARARPCARGASGGAVRESAGPVADPPDVDVGPYRRARKWPVTSRSSNRTASSRSTAFIPDQPGRAGLDCGGTDGSARTALRSWVVDRSKSRPPPRLVLGGAKSEEEGPFQSGRPPEWDVRRARDPGGKLGMPVLAGSAGSKVRDRTRMAMNPRARGTAASRAAASGTGGHRRRGRVPGRHQGSVARVGSI